MPGSELWQGYRHMCFQRRNPSNDREGHSRSYAVILLRVITADVKEATSHPSADSVSMNDEVCGIPDWQQEGYKKGKGFPTLDTERWARS